MKSVKYAAVASALAIVIAVVLSACGGSGTTTTVTDQAQPTQTTAPTTTPTTTPTTSSTATSTTSTTGSTTTAVGPSACGPDQAFSQVSHTCVNTRSGGNPCPKGQVPMADRPVCVSKQE